MFCKLSKALLECASQQDEALVTPVLTRARALFAYGIKSHMAMISARLAIQNRAAHGLHRALCAIGGRIATPTSVPTKLRLGTFRPVQLFPWSRVAMDDFLTAAAQRRIRREEDQEGDANANSAPPAGTVRPISFVLRCPRCHVPQEMRHTWLLRHGRSCTVRCNSCHCTSSARRWM